MESALSLVGGVSDDLREILEEDEAGGKTPTFDVQYLFDQVIPGLLQQAGEYGLVIPSDAKLSRFAETPFLQGRAFVFASQFASSLSKPLAGQYLAAAVQVLNSQEISVPVKISAVKTIKK